MDRQRRRQAGDRSRSRCLTGSYPQRLRKSEVERLDGAVVLDLDVGRLQIAMDNSLFVRRFKGIRDLAGNVESLVEGQPARGLRAEGSTAPKP